MTIFNFQEYWRTNFPECSPVSYLFKDLLKERWFRIHNLPESKRYAENDAERNEILKKQRLVLENIIGEGEECFFVCGCYNESPFRVYKDTFPKFAKFFTEEIEPISGKTFTTESEKENYIFRAAYGTQVLRISALDEIILAIADWHIAHFFIVNPQLNRIFAPYDGGVDLVLENTSKRDEYKFIFKDWLSKNPQGL